MLLRDVKIYQGEYDLSGDHNQIAIATRVDAKVKTTFGAAARISEAGLFESKANGQVGIAYGADEVDAVLFSKLAQSDIPVTLSPDGGAAGEVAHFFQAMLASYEPMGVSVGDLHVGRWAAEGSGGYPMIRGIVFVAAGSRTASFNSSVIELGAVAAGQRLFAAIHVLSASGTTPTLDAIVKSDDGSGFASPTNRITLAQKTAIGSEFASVAGAITDTFYRVDVTIGGTSPDFSAVIVVGIK
jgi:hypothetical protein